MVVNPGRTGQDGGHSETHYPWIQDHNSGIRSRYILNGNIFRLNQDFTDPHLTEPKSSTHKLGRISSTFGVANTCVSLIFIFQWGMRSEGLKKYLNICRFHLSSISHIGQLCHMRSSQDQIPSRPLSRNLVENLSLEIGQDQIPVSCGCKWTHNYSMPLPVPIIH